MICKRLVLCINMLTTVLYLKYITKTWYLIQDSADLVEQWSCNRVGDAQENARRPKSSKFTFGTSMCNPPAERNDWRDTFWCSSAARYSGVTSYKALCNSTSSLYSIRFLTCSQCNCRSIVVMDWRSPRRICITIRAADAGPFQDGAGDDR